MDTPETVTTTRAPAVLKTSDIQSLTFKMTLIINRDRAVAILAMFNVFVSIKAIAFYLI